MKAVVLEETGPRLVEDHPEPIAAEGEVAVDVIEAGICETDLQLVAGYMGYRGVLGHEFVGVPRTGRLAGRRVVGEINCSCGTCRLCESGLANHCPQRTVLGILGRDGAFAETLVLPETNLHEVPDGMADRVAVFAEPVAAALQVLEQVDVTGAESVTVLGDGRLGNLCAQVLASTGCRVRVVGKHDAKLAILEELGISTCRLERVSGERSDDLVVDATGSDTGLPTALGLVRPRGTVVLKTTIAGTQTLEMAPVVIDEVTVVGSRCGPFDKALVALENGTIDVSPLVAEGGGLDDATGALERVRDERDLVKVVLKVGSGY